MAKRSKKKKSLPEVQAQQGKMAEIRPPWWQRDEFRAALLIVAIVLAYQSVWQAGFIWDDDNHLTANPCIVGPLGLKSIWTTSSAMYYPLVLTTFWVEHALWGLAPLPYHLVNVLLHGACAILLWRVLRRLQAPGAWLGAALWALHPVQVESVAWITELKNTQSGLFYLLAILFFLNWHDADLIGKRRSLNYFLAIGCAVLALLSKSSTVMLPVVLALCAWWRGSRWSWREVAWLAPFFLISGAVSGWTIWEQKFHSGALGGEWGQSWPQRIVIAGRDIWFYLGKLAWPHPLIFIYPRWDIDASRLVEYLPVLAVAVALFWLWCERNGPMRPVFFALAYFVVSLFPVLGFFNVYFFCYSFVADHFQYLASMGPLALAGAGITTAFGWLKKPNPFLEPAMTGALLVTLGILSWSLCGMYADIETLWRTTLARNSDCWMADNNLGFALQQRGRVPEAMERYEQALRIKPDYAEAHNNLGFALQQRGQVPEAMEQYEQALRIKPDYAEAHNNLGNALLRTGRVPEAMEQCEEALRIEPNLAQAYYNLGNALRQTGRMPEAMEQYKQALRIKPDYAEARNNLGSAFGQIGRLSEAIAQFEQVLQIEPDYAEAHNNLGSALQQIGQLSEATEQYEQALRLKPDLAPARENLARLQALQKTAPTKN